MTKQEIHEPRAQADLGSDPYDRWVTPAGQFMAEFHRCEHGYLVRFPDEADFLISADCTAIDAYPAEAAEPKVIERLLHTAIAPIIGNHQGGLFLHGSAVRVGEEAIGFLGVSRSGKTTLAGAFAKAGYPFMTEDVIDLEVRSEGHWLRPKNSALRLFPDSAEFILGRVQRFDTSEGKVELRPGRNLAFSQDPACLRQLYILGEDHEAALCIARMNEQKALASMMPHAFLLDVEDKPRLRGHFSRLASLAHEVECFALDYRREYTELPSVCDAILTNLREGKERDETD